MTPELCGGIYLVLNNKNTIHYVGALSRLDYLSMRSCHNDYLVQTTFVANHTISFRLL